MCYIYRYGVALRQADLTSADFYNSNLSYANLCGANLTDASFRVINMEHTIKLNFLYITHKPL
jgi:uncharacterized protein YjbI with pentapeptide repeats